MKKLTEKQALEKLKNLKDDFREMIQTNYEIKAKNCLICETKGACCLDAHFVNVHITRLEAAAIRKTLEKLPKERQREIFERNQQTIKKYDLKSIGDTFSKTYACPLFEKETGCLVHFDGKPAPCIQHACYENKEDLPPDELQENIETRIERLNARTYGNAWNWLPLPVWLSKKLCSNS
jgi:hypothetical protein